MDFPTLAEAERKMACLMREALVFEREKDIGEEYELSGRSKVDPQFLRDRVLAYGEFLSTLPPFFDLLLGYEVYICNGPEVVVGLLSDRALSRYVDDPRAFHFATTKGLDIFGAVQHSLSLENYETHAVLCADGQWNIRVLLNEIESRRLCRGLHTRYRLAIEEQVLRLYRRFVGWTLPTLKTPEDVEHYFSHVSRRNSERN